MTPLEQMLTEQLEAIKPQLFELRRRVVELEEENRRLKAMLPIPRPPSPVVPETGFAVAVSDASGTRELIIPGTWIKLGTEASCNVKVDGARRLHAFIERDTSGAVTVTDLGTAEGTLLNGQRIARSTPFTSGDLIGINGAQIVVVFR